MQTITTIQFAVRELGVVLKSEAKTYRGLARSLPKTSITRVRFNAKAEAYRDAWERLSKIKLK